jgi:mono/diheme cytochrome c family protein
MMVTFSSTPSEARQTKLEKLQQKEAFWTVLATLSTVTHRIQEQEDCTQGPELRQYAEAVFAQIAKRFDGKEIITNRFKELNQDSFERLSSKDCLQKIADLQKLIVDEIQPPPMPVSWPDLQKGQVIYQQYCVSCHGTSKEVKGKLSGELRVVPKSFFMFKGPSHLSPLMNYAAIVAGVESSEMASFLDVLGKDEMWDVAFYVASLVHQKEVNDSCSIEALDLKTLSHASDARLSNQLGLSQCSLAYLRSMKSSSKQTIRIHESNDLDSGTRFKKFSAILIGVFLFVVLLYFGLSRYRR